MKATKTENRFQTAFQQPKTDLPKKTVWTFLTKTIQQSWDKKQRQGQRKTNSKADDKTKKYLYKVHYTKHYN